MLALVREDNAPSLRVVTKLGLAPDGVASHQDGSEHLRFVRAVGGAAQDAS